MYQKLNAGAASAGEQEMKQPLVELSDIWKSFGAIRALRGVVAQNDEAALGASSAIQAADRLGEFKVLIGVDGSKPALDAVAAGTLTATVFQDAVGQGTQAMVVASKILAGESVDPQYVIPFKLVTKDNVSSFK